VIDLNGKKVLVTGGGTGVGAAIATRLAEVGASVVITGRRQEPLATLASDHEKIDWKVCDVTDSSAVARLFDEIGRVDITVANAGSATSMPFSKMSHDDFGAMLDVNLTGVFSVWKAALNGLESDSWGRLIAIASTAGLKGYHYTAGYCAAKHGVIGLTKSLALELARSNVTVNAVCPGFVDTPLLEGAIKNIVETTGRSPADAEKMLRKNSPQNKFVQPEEVAETVLWLCGSQSGSITGQAIALSGGEI